MKGLGLNMENKTIIGVKIKSDKSGKFEGRTYNYYCDIDVRFGDIVVAPTSRGDSIACVCEVNVPMSRIDARIEQVMKTISAFATEEDHHVN